MTNATHTPGPLEVKHGTYIYEKHSSLMVGQAHYSENGAGTSYKQAMANAELFAAAPETARERDVLKAECDAWRENFGERAKALTLANNRAEKAEKAIRQQEENYLKALRPDFELSKPYAAALKQIDDLLAALNEAKVWAQQELEFRQASMDAEYISEAQIRVKKLDAALTNAEER